MPPFASADNEHLVTEIADFGEIVLIVAGGLTLALLSTKLNERIPIPAPGIFLVAAAILSDVIPSIGDHVSIRTVERIGVIALIVILFDGGMEVGWRRFRASAWPITALGIFGTFASAGLIAVAGHYLFGFSWTIAGIIGAALAPTDPAVMFSVLGNREVGGRSGTILEGESGVNDPVGIALMIGMIELATTDGASFWIVVEEFSVEMAVGLAVGVAGAGVLLPLMRRVSLPSESLYPLRTLIVAGVIYGAASVLHGSGFLAVFVAGLLLGDARAPFKVEIERFQSALASFAEITVFVALGLTIELGSLDENGVWLDGLLLALLLAFLVRPLVVAVLLAGTRLRLGERAFIAWSGLKGAVPILLASLVLLGGVSEADRIYGIVFVVVAFSVLVQGSLVPAAARRCGVPIRQRPLTPYNVSMRVEREPHGLQHFIVGEHARAAGKTVRDLPISEGTWLTLVVHGGEAVQPRGSYVLHPKDEVLVLSDPADEPALRRLFEGGVDGR
jgi:cell volume regulation protein A